MYKRFSIDQLTSISNNVISHTKNLLKIEKCTTFAEFTKKIFAQSQRVSFWEWSDPIMRFEKIDTQILVVDEKERIELLLDDQSIKSFHGLLKSTSKSWSTSMLDIIVWKFDSSDFDTIHGKPYIVYDIETMLAPADNNLKWLDFEMWYMIESREKVYKYIDHDSIKKFVDMLIAYDWWIIWYNNIRFDNPVIAYSAWYDQDIIDILDAKTLDIFVFLSHMTWRRLWLNKVATWLIGLAKTLDIGTLWVQLLTQYKENWDLEALQKVKEYCKGDVQMTLGVLIYLLSHLSFHREWAEMWFAYDDFVQHAQKKKIVWKKTHTWGFFE